MIPFKLNNEIALIPVKDLIDILARGIVHMKLLQDTFKDLDYSKQILEYTNSIEEISKHKTQ